jgi:predicted house-cleaning noncanonical NTP pyrophosphatase (MazG superfamily)
LIEEAKELQEDRNIEEFADLLEVIEALKKEM